MRSVYGVARQVRRPGGGPAGPVERVPGAVIPGVVRLSHGQLREGPEQAGARPTEDSYC